MLGAMQVGAIRAFGERVRTLRNGAGLSQAALAARADLDRIYLGRLERGRQNPSLLVVLRIAVELGVSPDALLDGLPVDAAELRAVRRLSRGPGRRKAEAS